MESSVKISVLEIPSSGNPDIVKSADDDSTKIEENPSDDQLLGPYVPFVWRKDSPTASIDSKPHSYFTITHRVSPKSKLDAEDVLEEETWLIGGPLGSRNSILVFRSSALANPTDTSVQSKPAYKLHITYKVSQAETKLLSKLLDCHGVSEVATNSTDFNLLWTGSHPKPGILRALAPHQRVNHFPRSYELTRKDRLYKNIEKMQHSKGFKHFDFIPQTFVMPGEFRELCSTHYRLKGPWIVKPVASSRGRGIFIVENPSQVPLDEPVVVAKYVNNPLLVDGHKCDLRLYILVTSMDPLLVYIYEEGLVRLATVRYDASHKQLWNPCMHLCNYSINKYHSDYVKSDDPTAENVGHKWTLSALLRHLKAQGKNTGLLMSQIEDVVVKAMLSSANSIVPACQMFVPNNNNCFELYGFDILIDEHLKPWLLEVNLSPSLGCDSPLDVRLKSAMLSDLLTLVGIPAVDPMIRASTCSVSTSSNSSVKSTGLKMKLSNCRRVHSADGLNSAVKKTSNSAQHNNRSNTLTLTTEELRLVRMAKLQFDRRGGFVRIHPTLDSWSKYSQYLDPITGVPTCGAPTSSYNLIVPHNYNYLIFTQLFSRIPEKHFNPDPRNSLITKRDRSVDNVERGIPQNRQDRYERMLNQGHRASLLPNKIPGRDRASAELTTQVLDMMKSGKRLSQAEARRTFSSYLSCVVKRISASPEPDGHVEIVLKFLQKASNYLQTPFAVKVPSHKLMGKDRAAIVAKQLNDFLYLYNRETDVYSDILDGSSLIPNKMLIQFLENARECDLEEVLILQSRQTTSTTNNSSTIQGILKYLPNVTKAARFKSMAPHRSAKNTVNVSHLS